MPDFPDPSTQAPEVALIAHPGGDPLEAPRENPALQLAASLAQTQQPLNDFLGELGTQMATAQQAKAQADALKSHGKALADAVRDGTILPTQNPWYIHEYNKQAAQVQAQGQMSTLQAQSQTWGERNDPAAFSQRWYTETGKIQAGIQATDPLDTHLGFQAAANPITQETLSQNTEYNVQRINAERIQNATTLATQTLMDTLKATPGASSQQLFQSLETGHQGWVNTGGSETQWRLLVAQAFTGAAANLQDASVVDHLRDSYLGGAPIANQADLTGKPIGLQLDSDTFWINRAAEAANSAAYRQWQATSQADGSKALVWAQQNYGYDLAFGNVPLDKLEQDLKAQGYSPGAIQWVVHEQAEQINSSNLYSRAQIEQYSQNPTVSAKILRLTVAAETGGWNGALDTQLTEAVGRREITYETASSILSRAVATSHWSQSEVRADRREAQSAGIAGQELALHRYSLIGDQSRVVMGQAVDTARAAGIDVEHTPKAREELQRTVDDAAMAAAEKGPEAARMASSQAAANWIIRHRKNPGQQQPGLLPSPGSNPRR